MENLDSIDWFHMDVETHSLWTSRANVWRLYISLENLIG